MNTLSRLCVVASLSVAAVASYTWAEPATQPTKAQTHCVVSDEELGGMGDPVVLNYEGREVKFCCQSCVKKFKKDPAKYIKKLDEAGSPSTQPTEAK